MLEFTANGKFLGDTIVLTVPGEVRVQARAESAASISRIEVVHNGIVVANGGVEATGRSASVDQVVRIDTSGWLGARVYGTGVSQAHTSPIYVDVAGGRVSSDGDAAYFLEWIDRLEAKFTSRDRAPARSVART